MADEKKNPIKEITDKLEKGIAELFESEKYKTYLNTMSKFHNYSFNNTLLIALQKPDATYVAGFDSWKKNFERHVNKGEKGIKIIAPCEYKKKIEQDIIDSVTGKPVFDAKGNIKTEEVEIKVPSYQAVTVFDVSQTAGKELPQLGVTELLAGVEGYKDMITALEKVAPVPIERANIASGAKGYFSPSEQKIVIQKDMSEAQTMKTLIHEISHSLTDDKDNQRIEVDLPENRTRGTKEVTAESVAYTVCQHFGIETSDYSFGYIAGWSSGKDMKELKESMDLIRKTSSNLINGIEGELNTIYKAREQEEEKTETEFSRDIIEEDNALPEDVEQAKDLLSAVDAYQPNVKVEEKSATKADKSKTKPETKAQTKTANKKTSLRARLDEKKEEVARKKTAPEPKRSKNLEREGL